MELQNPQKLQGLEPDGALKVIRAEIRKFVKGTSAHSRQDSEEVW